MMKFTKKNEKEKLSMDMLKFNLNYN